MNITTKEHEMSQEVRKTELNDKTQQLLEGPLKHIRAAALAAALVPLASVVATPAHAQSLCFSGGACGLVFNDTNNNGIQDAGETGISGVSVTVVYSDGTSKTAPTNPDGTFLILPPPGSSAPATKIEVQIPNDMEASQPNVGTNDSIDSDGTPDGHGNSVVTLNDNTSGLSQDFGFHASTVASPGTGTPGYWKNHPEAWPVQTITIGGVTYTKAQAIDLLDQTGKDKFITIFSSLVSAKLNVMIGNDSSCVASTITQADSWMATYGQPGHVAVAASSYAWKVGEPLHRLMDNYNNGMLCAPHRD